MFLTIQMWPESLDIGLAGGRAFAGDGALRTVASDKTPWRSYSVVNCSISTPPTDIWFLQLIALIPVTARTLPRKWRETINWPDIDN